MAPEVRTKSQLKIALFFGTRWGSNGFEPNNFGLPSQSSVFTFLGAPEFEPHDWVTGPWESCHASCGDSIQRRPVFCASLKSLKAVKERHCNKSEKPKEHRLCAKEACSVRHQVLANQYTNIISYWNLVFSPFLERNPCCGKRLWLLLHWNHQACRTKSVVPRTGQFHAPRWHISCEFYPGRRTHPLWGGHNHRSCVLLFQVG